MMLDDSAPNKKYFNPALVEVSDSLYRVDKTYSRGQAYPALRTVRDSFPSYGSPSKSSKRFLFHELIELVTNNFHVCVIKISYM